jgi:hypothetical protein
MPYAIENKLVVAVASSALFDLTDSDQVFRDKGEDAYREFQREKKDVCLSDALQWRYDPEPEINPTEAGFKGGFLSIFTKILLQQP